MFLNNEAVSIIPLSVRQKYNIKSIIKCKGNTERAISVFFSFKSDLLFFYIYTHIKGNYNTISKKFRSKISE